jgi:hypothetical protein
MALKIIKDGSIMLELQLKARDQKIREKWWRATLIYFVISTFLSIGMTDISLKLPNEQELKLARESFFSISSILISLAWLLIFWYCAYKKPGTKLLTFQIILGSLVIPLLVYALWHYHENILFTTTSIVNIGLYVWWYTFNLKLRRVNRKIQFQSKFSQEYGQSIQAIAESSNLDCLNLKFIELSQNRPALSYIFEEAYKLRKTELLCKKI